jgi:hypothetical protein
MAPPSAPLAASGDVDAARRVVARRLPRLRAVCGGMLAATVALSVAGPALLARGAPAPAPTDLSLILSLLAIVLILVASRLQQAILRRHAPAPPARSPAPGSLPPSSSATRTPAPGSQAAESPAPGRPAPGVPAPPAVEAAVAAYVRATLVSYALLMAAGLLGLVIAVGTGERRSAWVLGLAAATAMLVRWPTRSAMLRYLGLRPF